MTGYRRILCPIDTSESSRAALLAALSLARRFAATLEVLHVHSVPAYVQPSILVWAAVGPRPLWELAEDQAKAEVERFLAPLSAEDRAMVTVSYEVGDASNVILQRAEAFPASTCWCLGPTAAPGRDASCWGAWRNAWSGSHPAPCW